MYSGKSEMGYGKISKLLHWLIFLAVIIQLYSVFWVNWILPPHSPSAEFYIDRIHKPVGALVLMLVLFSLLWKINHPRPSFPLHMKAWEILSARLVHALLYIGLLIMPITGLIMSTAAGYPPNFFGFYQFPSFLEKNDALAKLFFTFHKTVAFIVIGLVALHVLAALKHHLIDKDNVLKRMLPWGK